MKTNLSKPQHRKEADFQQAKAKQSSSEIAVPSQPVKQFPSAGEKVEIVLEPAVVAEQAKPFKKSGRKTAAKAALKTAPVEPPQASIAVQMQDEVVQVAEVEQKQAEENVELVAVLQAASEFEAPSSAVQQAGEDDDAEQVVAPAASSQDVVDDKDLAEEEQSEGDEASLSEDNEFDKAAKQVASLTDVPVDKSFLSRGQQKLDVSAQVGGKDAMRIIEAALFLSNKPLPFADLALISKTTVRKARELCEKLSKEYASRGGAVELTLDSVQASMQVKADYLAPVAQLSKNVELTRKSTRILALIAKKGKLFQSELRKYFRGDIYAYISELKDLGYISSEKHGNTRLIKPTSKFFENFQLGAFEAAAQSPQQPASGAAQKAESSTPSPSQPVNDAGSQ